VRLSGRVHLTLCHGVMACHGMSWRVPCVARPTRATCRQVVEQTLVSPWPHAPCQTGVGRRHPARLLTSTLNALLTMQIWCKCKRASSDRPLEGSRSAAASADASLAEQRVREHPVAHTLLAESSDSGHSEQASFHGRAHARRTGAVGEGCEAACRPACSAAPPGPGPRGLVAHGLSDGTGVHGTLTRRRARWWKRAWPALWRGRPQRTR
jgi:hypothetical protein